MTGLIDSYLVSVGWHTPMHLILALDILCLMSDCNRMLFPCTHTHTSVIVLQSSWLSHPVVLSPHYIRLWLHISLLGGVLVH